jgi:hypothetical protein
MFFLVCSKEEIIILNFSRSNKEIDFFSCKEKRKRKMLYCRTIAIKRECRIFFPTVFVLKKKKQNQAKFRMLLDI